MADGMRDSGLELKNTSKKFGDFTAVDTVSLNVAAGELMAVLGPSGCGKTTLLRLVAGFEKLNQGSISLDGRMLSGPGEHLPPEKRRIGIVFQTYALWPHMDVAGNVGYPLKVEGASQSEMQAKINQALSLVGLDGMGHRAPAELSGGQRQRVALARCLVMDPALVLLDEPLANLDAHLRSAMVKQFAKFHEQTGSSMLYVTHDQAEAMALAHKVAIMDQGRLVCVDTPQNLYDRPQSPMVAGFIGISSQLPVTVLRAENGTCKARVMGAEVELRCDKGQKAGHASACLRPDDLAISSNGSSSIKARVASVSYQGGYYAAECAAGEQGRDSLVLHIKDQPAPDSGEEINVSIAGGWVIPR